MYVYRRLARFRRILFWAAAALYIATFPMIILSVTGIKLQPVLRQPFVRTGALEVTTRPEGCTVTLSGRTRKPLTPAVIEGLVPGRYELVVKPPSGHPWRGLVEIAAGEVTSLRGLPAGSPSRLPVSLPDAAVRAAYSSPASATALLVLAADPGIALVDLATGRQLPVRGLALPGPVADVTPLPSEVEFLLQVSTDARAGSEGAQVAVLLDQSTLGGWSATELSFGVPEGAIPLAASWRDRSLLFLDGSRIVHRSQQGDQTVFVAPSRVIALGFAHGERLLLDADGWLYSQSRLLAPRPIAVYPVADLVREDGRAPARIVAENRGVLAVQQGSSLYLLARTRALELADVSGAAYDEQRERLVVWEGGRVGCVFQPWGDLEASAVTPAIVWTVETAEAVREVLPLRDSDAALITAEGAVLAGVLSERATLAPVPLAELPLGAPRPVLDTAGAILVAARAGSVELLRLAPLALPRGENR